MKRLIYVLLPILLLTSLVFTNISAESTTTLYVSVTGNDTNDGSTEESALATLAKAAEIVNSDTEGNKYIIVVTSDLTMSTAARFYDHDVTITGKGDTIPVVTRADEFNSLSDDARSWYNPAMFELQTSSKEASLTFENIILDDNFKHEGTVFAQAISGEGKSDNTVYVQDAIVASNATKKATITLGKGTTLRNFGGMSAVRVTSSATVVMESGSVIEDSTSYTRTKGTASDEVGAAGAIWCQGGTVVMNEGSTIKNVNGRAIYVDGGTLTVSGTIKDITSNKNVWKKDEGTAIHLRNKATATLTSTALIEYPSITSSGNVIRVSGGCNLTADKGSVIKSISKATGISITDDAIVYFDGEILWLTGASNQVMNIQNDGFKVTLGKNSNIYYNTTLNGSVYIQGNGELHLYGKIKDNYNFGSRSGAIYVAHNLGASTVYMYDGAEIRNNYSSETGGGVLISKSTFYMQGGTITENVAKDEGGGVYVRNGGKFVMNGGTIKLNYSGSFGGGIAYKSVRWSSTLDSCVEINGGTISNNQMNCTVRELDNGYYVSCENSVKNDIGIDSAGDFAYTDRCVRINDTSVLSVKDIYFKQDNKTITAVNNSKSSVWLGNANKSVVTQLEAESKAKGWTSSIASFYVYRGSKSVELKISGISFDGNLPVYAVVVKGVDSTGAIETGATTNFYNTTVKGKDIYLTIPASNDEDTLGYEVILVQPSTDHGNVTITGPSEIKQDMSLSEYVVDYTATYTMSESFMNTVNMMKDKVTDDNCKFTFVVELDSRLTAEYVSFESPIFTADTDNVVVDGNKITVTCKLKSDWKDHISELATTPMVLKGNGILAAEDFNVGDILNTTGHIDVTLPNGNIYLPANVVNTLEVASTGSLTITKEVKGDVPTDLDMKFNFELDVNNKEFNGEYGDLVFENGVAEFSFTGSGSITVELPAGLEYTVTELNENEGNFKTTYENNKGKIKADEALGVVITNTYIANKQPSTGDHSHIYVVIAVMVISAVAATYFMVRKKKHSH